MTVQNDNTILKKADLKAYHERIAPMLGGTFMVGTNNSDFYSTDEKVVGVWTDGRPLYQRTVAITTPSTANTNAAVYTDSNTNVRIQEVYGGFSYNNDRTNYNGRPLNYWCDSTDYSGAYGGSYGYQLVMNVSSGNTSKQGYATLRYTKTTDAAGSATTTPGAYDINFPNTWPANKEIFFGNGMYGYRATGNVVTAGNTLPISGIKKFYGYGGSSDNGAGANVHTFPYTNPSALPQWGNCVWADHNNGIPHIYWGTGYTTNTTFDIWLKYTK